MAHIRYSNNLFPGNNAMIQHEMPRFDTKKGSGKEYSDRVLMSYSPGIVLSFSQTFLIRTWTDNYLPNKLDNLYCKICKDFQRSNRQWQEHLDPMMLNVNASLYRTVMNLYIIETSLQCHQLAHSPRPLSLLLIHVLTIIVGRVVCVVRSTLLICLYYMYFL